ncbi:MAG: hypothetical protein ABI673_00500 [Novosphingobium sp.]
MSNFKTLKEICEKHYDKYIYDCSGFLKAVAKDVGISLSGQANGIIDQMAKSPWTSHGHDAKAAIQAAGQRKLVVAGLKATPNGHVAIIMPTASSPYATAYWGSIGKHPGRNKTLNWSWGKTDLPKVKYFSCPIPSPIAIR